LARILWIGDAGSHTGFARVTHNIGDRLVTDYGHEVSVLAANYLGDWWPTPMHLYIPTKLNRLDVYGQTRIVELLAEVMPEAIVMLNDPLPMLHLLFDNKYDTERLLLQGGGLGAPILAYLPVDGENYPSPVDILAKVTQPIAMSRHGLTLFPNAEVVLHGVDTERYHPVSVGDPIVTSNGRVITTKREAKAAFGFDPEGFLILRVDRNSIRKDYPSTWRALVPVMKRHRDITVHFHCQARDDYDLRTMLTREPEVADRFRFPDQVTSFKGWPEQDLAVLYNAADLFVSTSWAEGFGLTIAEAVASGVPVVAQRVASIPEVVGPAGRLVDPLQPITMPMGHDQRLPDVAAFSEAIERLYQGPGSRRKMGEAGVAHVAATMSWDVAASHFDRLIRRSISGPAAGPGPTPGRAVQHRDESADGEGSTGRSSDLALHGVLDD
jgi:glycosyltransferase involved in cell wall biosynthesis